MISTNKNLCAIIIFSVDADHYQIKSEYNEATFLTFRDSSTILARSDIKQMFLIYQFSNPRKIVKHRNHHIK